MAVKRGFVSMVNKCFDKTCSNGAVTRADKSAIKREIIPNQQLAGESYKPIIHNEYKLHKTWADQVN